MKKKIVSLALVASLLALVIVGGTLAYFTDTESAENTFVVGNVDIDLTEPSWRDSNVENIQPGMTYAKDPTVANTGVNNAYIRVNVTLNKWTEFSTAAASYGITDLTSIFTVANNFDTTWKLAGTPVVSGNTVTYSYYYIANNGVLAPGGSTGTLFTAVTIPWQFNNAQMAALRPDFTLTVTADAIQADTFTSVEAAFAAFDAQSAAQNGNGMVAIPTTVTP